MKAVRFNSVSLSIILVIITFISACSPSLKVLYSDDFSNPESGWDRGKTEKFTTNYYNDAYRIVVDDQGYDVWANPAGYNFKDVRIEVNATVNGGPVNNDFGIICRYVSTDKFYYAIITSDGYYAIMKKGGYGKIQLNGSMMKKSDLITGDPLQKIRFDCVGSTLTLYINGNQLDQVTDEEYTTGNVGLTAGTYHNPGVDILFDDFTVYQPEGTN